MLHKRYQYNIKNQRKILKNNKLMLVKADKCKAIMIIKENTLEKEIYYFIQENKIKQLNNMYRHVPKKSNKNFKNAKH